MLSKTQRWATLLELIYDVNMKLGLLSKIGKKNTMALRKFVDEIIPENYDIIVSFTIYSQ